MIAFITLNESTVMPKKPTDPATMEIIVMCSIPVTEMENLITLYSECTDTVYLAVNSSLEIMIMKNLKVQTKLYESYLGVLSGYFY